jgi:hypothetical protein
MLVDSFQAFDEIELALFRIQFLSQYVDKVIIGESNLTHSGITKPLYFREYFSNHETELSQKVKIITLDLSGLSDSWSREIKSRELVIKHIFEHYPQAYFINSDLDEIPSLESLDMLQTSTEEFYHFSAKTYYRYANWALRDSHQEWNRGVLGHTSGQEPENGGRFTKFHNIPSKSKGAHFSYVGRSYDSYALKLESFAHTELNRANLKSRDFLNFADYYAIDHLGRSRESSFGLLKVMPEAEFDQIQSELFKQYPDFFRFPKQLPSSISRFIASIAITSIINSGFQHRAIYRFFIDKDMTLSVRVGSILGTTYEVLVSMLFLFRRRVLKWKSKFQKSYLEFPGRRPGIL